MSDLIFGQGTTPRRPLFRAEIDRAGGPGRRYSEPYTWEATIKRGVHWYDAKQFPTHAEALEWALEQLKEADR